MDRADLAHRLGESGAIVDHSAVDDDRHMPAQGRLVVEHIGARLRIAGEHVVEDLAHGRAGCLDVRADDVTLDVLREYDLGHGVTLLPITAPCMSGFFPPFGKKATAG